jgi:hypothetical protein
MQTVMQNIRFHYKYRDAANYKEYGSVIFSNTTQISIAVIQELLKEALIDQEYFVPVACGIPLIHSFPFDPELDHAWYELDYIEETIKPVTDVRDMQTFITDCADAHFSKK